MASGDDGRPKHIAPDDPAYQRLRSTVAYSFAFAGWGVVTWGALLVHLWKRLPKRKLLWLAAVFLLAEWVFLLEPTQRFAWWLD